MQGQEITYKPEPKRQKLVPRALDGTFFEIVSNNESKIEAKCKLCLEIKKGNLKSTGNFINHYKSKHQNEYLELENYLKVRYRSNKTQLQAKSNYFPPLTPIEVVVNRFWLLYIFAFRKLQFRCISDFE